MSHTKGPWSVTAGDGRERGYIRREGAPRGELAVARVCSAITRKASEADANARLIAAAPDLLAALEGLVELLELDDEATTPGTDSYMSLLTANTAIQKARGEG